MEKININDLPEALESKKISMDKAINAVWAEIYINPHRYGLEDFSEDEKSDFLIDFREKISLLFSKYDKNLATFSAFLRGCIAFMKSSWKKRVLKETSDKKTAESFLIDKLKNDLTKFSSENLSESNIKNKSSKKESDCKIKIKTLTVLVLALKACRDIDDDLISKISKFTEMSENALHKLVQEMKNVALQNENAREKLIAKRNNAFYFRRKYVMEMRETGINSFSYEKLKSRYEHQTKNWIKSNELLAKRGINAPTNVDVAKKLGLKPRTVGFYLFKAKKNLSGSQKEKTDALEDSDEKI